MCQSAQKIHRITFSLYSVWACSLHFHHTAQPEYSLSSSEHSLSKNTGDSFPFCHFYKPQVKILGGFFFQEMNYRTGETFPGNMLICFFTAISFAAACWNCLQENSELHESTLLQHVSRQITYNNFLSHKK